MGSLKYVGASPGADNAVVNRTSVAEYIGRSLPSLTPASQQAEERGATYPSQGEVSQTMSQYARTADVSVEAEKYVASSDVGSSVASLTSGKLPSAQWPANFVQYLEPSGAKANTGGGFGTSSRYYETEVASATVTNQAYKWTPFVTGFVEFETGPWTIGAMRIRDESNRLIAEGYSSPGGIAPAMLGMKNSYTYTSSQTFRLMIAHQDGTDAASLTGWHGEALIVPVPV